MQRDDLDMVESGMICGKSQIAKAALLVSIGYNVFFGILALAKPHILGRR